MNRLLDGIDDLADDFRMSGLPPLRRKYCLHPRTPSRTKKDVAAAEADRRRQAHKYGQCVCCEEPAVTKNHCEKHRLSVLASMKARRGAKIARGECVHCAMPARPGLRTCQKHQGRK